MTKIHRITNFDETGVFVFLSVAAVNTENIVKSEGMYAISSIFCFGNFLGWHFRPAQMTHADCRPCKNLTIGFA